MSSSDAPGLGENTSGFEKFTLEIGTKFNLRDIDKYGVKILGHGYEVIEKMVSMVYTCSNPEGKNFKVCNGKIISIGNSKLKRIDSLMSFVSKIVEKIFSGEIKFNIFKTRFKTNKVLTEE